MEAVCPLCHADEPAVPEKKDGCPCLKDLVQRDLAPRAGTLEQTAWTLAHLSEFTHRTELPAAHNTNPFLAQMFMPLPTGPPRLFLRHRALLC